ncbi:jg1613 [Pararge aegeria aegeria]|uniref:Jg1613 protein n=1 Tax=Pararge aegeria aegeria TaxID=348720 RepID=A0A8S4RBI8_9NEOP|nr:jg1613 [Pararge aegeria aegeria]
MWSLRNIFKISWRQCISNAQVLRMAKCHRKLMTTGIQRKVAFFGHLHRGSLFEFPRLILEGKITGKRAPGAGRPRKKWFDDIREWTGHTYSELMMAHHRSIFHRLTSELQYKDGN